MEGEWVSLHENGDPLPPDFEPFTWEGRQWLTRGTRTDKDGRYSFRVGPGEHVLRIGATADEKLRIGSEETVTRDLLLSEADEPGGVKVDGLVRDRSGAGLKPAPSAMVQGLSDLQQIVAHGRGGQVRVSLQKARRWSSSRTIATARAPDSPS